MTSITGPFRASAGLNTLAPLWRELHLHHLRVASYGPLVEDVDASWQRRQAWYERLLADDGAYFIAVDDDGQAVGYAFAQVLGGADDTFEVENGVVELISLVVRAEARGRGVGKLLMSAAEQLARSRGIDTLKVAVMAGNEGARGFYETASFSLGELVLYRRLTD